MQLCPYVMNAVLGSENKICDFLTILSNVKDQLNLHHGADMRVIGDIRMEIEKCIQSGLLLRYQNCYIVPAKLKTFKTFDEMVKSLLQDKPVTKPKKESPKKIVSKKPVKRLSQSRRKSK